MLTFLVVLGIGIVAFADAFYSIYMALALEDRIVVIKPFDAEANNYEKYWQSYVAALQSSFLTSLGDFGQINLTHFREIDWVMFVLCCVFNIIVLLNLLIAIISATYTRIAEQSIQNSYKEKTIQISMMQDTLLGHFKNQEDPNELVFIAKIIESVDIKEKKINEEISNLKKELHEELEKVRIEQAKVFLSVH